MKRRRPFSPGFALVSGVLSDKSGKLADKQGEHRIHLARLHHSVLKNCFYFSVMGLGYILAPRSGRAKTIAPERGRKNPNVGYVGAFDLPMIKSIKTPQPATVGVTISCLEDCARAEQKKHHAAMR